MIKMMKYGEVPSSEIFARGTAETDVSDIVADILAEVRQKGDAALFAYAKQFDKADLQALEEDDYFRANCRRIIETREYVSAELQKRGFTLTDSQANFLFAKSDRIDGEALYRRLREKGVLIRHFTKERIKDYNRITIGSREEMEIFLQKTDEILEELV